GQQQLAPAQQTVCRRKPGSHHCREANRRVACQPLTISRQRRDCHCKMAHQYATRYTRICVQDLNRTARVRNHQRAKSLHDAAVGARASTCSPTRLRERVRWWCAYRHVSRRTTAAAAVTRSTRASVVARYLPLLRTLVEDRDVHAASNVLQ